MVIWKVTCHWHQENDYSYYDHEPTDIGIFTSRPLAALAAIDFIECMNHRYRNGDPYFRVISEVWNHCIEILEHDLHDNCSYEFATIYFTKMTLNDGLTY